MGMGVDGTAVECEECCRVLCSVGRNDRMI